MSCDRFQDALSGAAAGSPAAPELEAHLASCEPCRTELAALSRALAAADEELSALAAATPSPRLRASIHAAVAAEPKRTAARASWLWAGVAAAALLAIAWMARSPLRDARVAVERESAAGDSRAAVGRLAPGRGAPEGPTSRGSGSGSSGAASGERGGQMTAPSSVGTGGGAARAVTSTRVATRASVAPPAGRGTALDTREVLVAPGEADALRRLVAIVHRERLTPSVLGAVERPASDLRELSPIDIAPLEIVPLDPEESSGYPERGETP